MAGITTLINNVAKLDCKCDAMQVQLDAISAKYSSRQSFMDENLDDTNPEAFNKLSSSEELDAFEQMLRSDKDGRTVIVSIINKMRI